MKDKRKTWFIDFDGTLVYQKSHLKEKDYILPSTENFFKHVVKEEDYVIITTGRDESYKERMVKFLKSYAIKYDLIICNLPTGPRILVNDKKPDGAITAHSFNLERDEGIDIEEFKKQLCID